MFQTCYMYTTQSTREGTCRHECTQAITIFDFENPISPNEAGDQCLNKDVYLNEFVQVSGSWEFQAGDDDLWSFVLVDFHTLFKQSWSTSVNSYIAILTLFIMVDLFQDSVEGFERDLISARLY